MNPLSQDAQDATLAANLMTLAAVEPCPQVSASKQGVECGAQEMVSNPGAVTTSWQHHPGTDHGTRMVRMR